MMPTIESLLKVQDVAKLTGLSVRSIWKLLASGRMPAAVRIGRAVRFRATEINEWISAGCPSREQLETRRVMREAE